KGIGEIYSYGTNHADITGVTEQASPFLKVNITRGSSAGSIQTKLTGDYNLPNVLAAVCLGSYFKVDPVLIRKGIENYEPSNSRSQLIQKGSIFIVLDAYNANPSSMKLAIENFVHFPAANKILLLGAMMELGPDSLAEHRQIVQQIEKNQWKEVALVGGDFLKIKHPYRSFTNADEAGAWIASQTFGNTAILVKGSRSMQMEKTIQSLVKEP
ncbi:MAG TPA: cyanophycin synthetase, partial [Puia sp.]|nr:cyanophycin synthetase [Puia sp.]